MSLPEDIATTIRIKLDMYKEAGLDSNNPVIVADISNYIVALLCSQEVRKIADAYVASAEQTPVRAGY